MTKYSNDEIKDMLDEYCNRIGMLTSQHIFLLSEVFSQGATDRKSTRLNSSHT